MRVLSKLSCLVGFHSWNKGVKSRHCKRCPKRQMLVNDGISEQWIDSEGVNQWIKN